MTDPHPPAGAAVPDTAVELVETLDLMRDALGPPEAMESPRARAVYLLNRTRLTAAQRAARPVEPG